MSATTMEQTMDQEANTRILRADAAEQREAIYRFRYQIYVDEMGKRLSYADHERRMLYDALDDSADHFLVEHQGEAIATARLNQLGSTDFGDYWRQVYKLREWAEFPDSTISMSSRLMVAASWRGSAVLGGLLMTLFEHSRRLGVRFNFLNCSPSLLEFYEQLGYRRYTDGFVDEDVGYHVPMVFITEDLDYMRRVRSPFLRAARHFPADPSGTAWFERQFPEHAAHVNRRLVEPEQFWEILEQNLHADPKRGISLLANLDEEEAQQFLGTGTVLPCKAEDVIIRPGDVGNEMFVVLEGVVEVLGGNDQHPVSLAVLGPGKVFGEIAFVSKAPRTAKVVARTDVKVLILTQAFFKKAMKNMPAIVAKVLLNLSVTLCERLTNSTQSWVEAVRTSRETEDQPS